MKRVFVSYSRHNLDSVKEVINNLKAAGIDVWHDQTLTGGQHWWDKILASIRERDVFILALSPESLESEACKSELSYVMQLGKAILPVIVADGVNLNLLPHPLSEIQATDCRGDLKSVLALVASINSAPDCPALPDPLPTPPQVPRSYGDIVDLVESPNPLSSQEQIQLLFKIEEEFYDDKSRVDLRDILLRLKRRDELLAKIDNKIDQLLERLNESPAPRSRFACPSCGLQLDPAVKFCGHCGAKPGEPTPPPPDLSNTKSRRYTCAAADTPALIADLKRWLEGQNFQSQQGNLKDGAIVLQVKKPGEVRRWFGMATTLDVTFRQSGDTLTVEMSAGKWVDKIGAGAVGLFVLWPLAFSAAYGAWEQIKMPNKIFDFIGARLAYK
jgi:hypothetical protein